MKSKRHAKPTALQLSERTYRKVLEFKRIILNQMAIIRLDIMEARIQDRTHMRTLTDHCARLLREKETLMKMKDISVYRTTQAELDASLYIAEPPKRQSFDEFIAGKCPYANSHRINHTCAHCGRLIIDPANYVS